MIHSDWKEELHKLITAIVQNYGHKVLIINSMPDHVHLLCGMSPDHSFSDLMRIVKSETSKWINGKNLTRDTFRWQHGFGAFSYDRSKINVVANYIANQEKHHAKKTLIEEFKQCLTDFKVDYDERYIFRAPE